jgi:hypothetical protein
MYAIDVRITSIAYTDYRRSSGHEGVDDRSLLPKPNKLPLFTSSDALVLS